MITNSRGARRRCCKASDWLPDDTLLLDLDHRMVCTRCGLIGADVRPDWTPMTGSAGMGGSHSLSLTWLLFCSAAFNRKHLP
jgi:hypothetical protein